METILDAAVDLHVAVADLCAVAVAVAVVEGSGQAASLSSSFAACVEADQARKSRGKKRQIDPQS
jgi:hypothetical protein